jgi:hypothetical protein
LIVAAGGHGFGFGVCIPPSPPLELPAPLSSPLVPESGVAPLLPDELLELLLLLVLPELLELPLLELVEPLEPLEPLLELEDEVPLPELLDAAASGLVPPPLSAEHPAP